MYQEKIKQILLKEHKTEPTIIQKQTYDAIKNGASLIGLAKTGTGKTLAYALPSLERTEKGKANSVVILAPTTELAVQIRHAINPYLHALDVKGATLVGAGNRKRQEDNLKKKQKELKALKNELFKLRFQHSLKGLDNPKKLTLVRKEIARVNTLITEKESN